MGVTANITVSFGAGTTASESSHLSAEIDDRPEGLNAGDTSFAPGDTAHFLVFQSDGVTHDAPVSSGGSIGSGSTITVEREDELTFADEDTAELSVPAAGLGAITWYGNALGGLALQPDKKTVKASAKGVAVAKVKYTASATAYGLTSPATLAGAVDYSILVYILGHEVAAT